MRRLLTIAITTATAFAAWGATAAWGRNSIPVRPSGSSTPLRLGAATGTATSFTEIPVRLRGTLAVRFHGDHATGCASRGLCGFSGTVIWQPPPTATLQATMFRDHGQTEYDVSLQLLGNLDAAAGPASEGGVTTADVRFAPNGSAGAASNCNDAAFTGADIDMPVHLRAASLTLAAAAPSLLGTRCAGPLQSDIASQLARRVVDVASLSHGRTGVSLASSSDFAVRGLAGTVTSTVELRLGRPDTRREGTGGSSSKQPKSRMVEIDYPARLNGSALIHTHGDPSSCAALGSCGANGTFALHVHGTPGTLRIFALATSRRPLRDQLAALGVRKLGNPRGILIVGGLLVRGPATYDVDVAQGANTCRDSAPPGPGVLFVSGVGGPVTAAFSQGPPQLHLRCPGPMLSLDKGLVSSRLRLARFRRGGTIHLKTVHEFHDDGYTARAEANVTVTLSRPKVKITTDALRAPNAG
jgi:hypothetical protein